MTETREVEEDEFARARQPKNREAANPVAWSETAVAANPVAHAITTIFPTT